MRCADFIREAVPEVLVEFRKRGGQVRSLSAERPGSCAKKLHQDALPQVEVLFLDLMRRGIQRKHQLGEDADE